VGQENTGAIEVCVVLGLTIPRSVAICPPNSSIMIRQIVLSTKPTDPATRLFRQTRILRGLGREMQGLFDFIVGELLAFGKRPSRLSVQTRSAYVCIWLEAESVLQAGWGKERCCKSGGISGNFRWCWCGSQTVGGAPDENRFTTSRTGEMGIKSSPCLKSKRRFRIKSRREFRKLSGSRQKSLGEKLL